MSSINDSTQNGISTQFFIKLNPNIDEPSIVRELNDWVKFGKAYEKQIHEKEVQKLLCWDLRVDNRKLTLTGLTIDGSGVTHSGFCAILPHDNKGSVLCALMGYEKATVYLLERSWNVSCVNLWISNVRSYGVSLDKDTLSYLFENNNDVHKE